MAKGRITASAVAAMMAGTTGVALADVPPSVVEGNPLVLVGVGVVVLLVLWMLIRGALSLGSKSDGEDDSSGVGILEGIDDDDDDRKKKKR